MNKTSLINALFRYGEMESHFQGKAPDEDMIGQLQQNNKRSTMTLNMSGLWDVVPRLDHYRYKLN